MFKAYSEKVDQAFLGNYYRAKTGDYGHWIEQNAGNVFIGGIPGEQVKVAGSYVESWKWVSETNVGGGVNANEGGGSYGGGNNNWIRDLSWTTGNLTAQVIQGAAKLANFSRCIKPVPYVGLGAALVAAGIDHNNAPKQTSQQITAANRQLGANIGFAALGASASLWRPFAPIPIVISVGFAIGDNSGWFDLIYKY